MPPQFQHRLRKEKQYQSRLQRFHLSPEIEGSGFESNISKVHHSKGGYVSSALERKHSFENQPSTIPDRKPLVQPRKADYVSSARKSDKSEKDDKGPIDTVIFASINPQQKSGPVSSARKHLGEVSSYEVSKPVPEPRMIPTGQIDYVSSAKPKKTPPPVSPRSKTSPTSSPRSKEFPISPYAYEEPSPTKIQPVKLNSALSPRGKSGGSAFTFGTSFGKGGDRQGNSTKSPLSSPLASPRTAGDSACLTRKYLSKVSCLIALHKRRPLSQTTKGRILS